jgi:hypothetical protein
MHGPATRLIKRLGSTYTVRNSTSGSGGRDTLSYSDDGTLVGVIEQRGRGRTMTDSGGEDVEADLEIRAVLDSGVTINPAGVADGYPSILVHPNGREFRVVDHFAEDSGVDVLTVVRN